MTINIAMSCWMYFETTIAKVVYQEEEYWMYVTLAQPDKTQLDIYWLYDLWISIGYLYWL